SETEGNPFFVEELFQHLAEAGRLFDAKGHWRSDREVSELDVPRGVRLVIGRRLERVGEECRRVLTSAAVIGRAFTFELLEALVEADTDALLDAVDEAERANLISAAEDGPEARFTFAHELIRQTLVSGLSLPRRQRMHLRVAEAIEQAYPRSLEEHAADLAHHLHQAGAAADPEKTVRYLTMAGEQALGAAAFEDALRHYEDALSLQPADNQKARADLQYRRGQALRGLGRWEEALADWRQALDTYEELEDAEAVGRLGHQLSWQLAWAFRTAEGVQVARRGLAALGEQASADRCRLLGAAGTNLSLGGDYATADPMLAQALEMAERLGDQRLLGQALTYMTAHHFYYMQAPETVDAGLRAAELLRAAGDLWDVADVLWYPQYALLLLGRLDEAAKIGEELEPLATRVGHMGALLIAGRARGVRDFLLTGDIDGYGEFASRDMELCRSIGIPLVSNSYAYLGTVDFWRGRWQEALKNHEEAARLEPPGMLAGADWAGLFLGKAYAGDREESLAMLDERRDNLPRPGQANTWGAWAMLMAVVEGLAVLRKLDEAAELYPLVIYATATGVLLPWLGLLETVAGIAAACGSQWEKAEEHYQTALRQAHELPHKIEQPEVRRWYARMLIDRDAPGDRDKARELLTEAIAMYRKIGMPKHVEMAEALLAET
ncbi:MAG: tetratricopeptide repeat protein, partial [Dehalococcoidia bacterium]